MKLEIKSVVFGVFGTDRAGETIPPEDQKPAYRIAFFGERDKVTINTLSRREKTELETADEDSLVARMARAQATDKASLDAWLPAMGAALRADREAARAEGRAVKYTPPAGTFVPVTRDPDVLDAEGKVTRRGFLHLDIHPSLDGGGMAYADPDA